MEQVEVGDILLFRGTSWLSRLIQAGTNSPYSHVAVVASSDIHITIEAMSGKGVRAIDTRTIKNADIYRVKPEYFYDEDTMLSFLVGMLNRHYDYLGVAYLAFLKLFQLKKRANKWQKDQDFFCSELVHSAFWAGGLNIVPDKGASETISPADIANSNVVEKV